MNILLSLLFLFSTAFADTPSGSTTLLKGNTDGTKIGNVGDALKVSGNFFQSVQPVSQSGSWSVLSQQSGTWNVGRTWTLGFSTDKVDASGSSVSVSNFPSTFGVTQGTSPWVVGGSLGRTWSLLNTTDSVNVGNFPSNQNVTVSNSTLAVTQSTNPWLERLTDGTNSLSKLFDLDTSGSTHEYNLGASIRLPASGGSVAGGTSTNPIRTDPTGTTIQPVNGTVTANIGTTNGLALDASLATVITRLQTIITNLGSPFQAGGSIGNTSFNVGNFPAFALDSTLSALSAKFGSLGQKTMAGSAPVVIASDQSAIHTIVDSGSVTATISGTVPVSGPLTDAQLRASAVPVSGNLGRTWSLLSGTDSIATEPTSASISGTLNSGSGAGSFLQLDAANMNSWSIDFTQTPQSLIGQIEFEKSKNGVGWVSSFCYNAQIATPSPFAQSGSSPNMQFVYQCDATGFDHFRARVASYGSGSSPIILSASKNQYNIMLENLFTLGTNLNPGFYVGIEQDDVGLAKNVDLQKLTLAQASTTSGQTGPLVQGAVTTSAPSYTTATTRPLSLTTAGALRTDSSGTTQPVSQTSAPWTHRLVDGADASIIATITANHALKVDATATTQPVSATNVLASNFNAQVVGNVTSGASDAGNPVKIGGKFNTTQPTVTDGSRIDAQMTNRGAQIIAKGVEGFSIDNTSFTATQATGTNLHTVVDSGSITAVQPTGTNFHTVVDSAPTTAVTGPLTDTQLRATPPTVNSVLRSSGGTEIGTTANPVKVDDSQSFQAATSTLTQISASVTSVSVLALNASRMYFVLVNDSSSICYVAFSATATTSAYTLRMPPNSVYNSDLPVYTGAISAIWVSATGSLKVTEVTQ